jgi:hypothetical protein
MLAIGLFVPNQAASDTVTVPNWETLAKQYVLADQELLELEEKKLQGIKTQGIWELLDLRDELRASLAKLPPPTIDQLKPLLGVSDSLKRKIALVGIFLNKITDSDIIQNILHRYSKDDDFFAQFYSHQALMNLSDSRLQAVQADVSRIIAAEKYETLQVTSLPTLLRLQRDIAVPILVTYFKKGSPGLKMAAYAALRSNERSKDIEEIKAALKADNAMSAIEFLNELEKK